MRIIFDLFYKLKYFEYFFTPAELKISVANKKEENPTISNLKIPLKDFQEAKVLIYLLVTQSSDIL